MKKPSKSQKKRFTKGFWWGRVEHKTETLCTYTLLIGLLFQVTGLLTKRWIWSLIATGFFVIALFFRFISGVSHKLEKHYMKYLRFGAWKKKNK